MTELADTLVRSEEITFRQSHLIVSNCVNALMAASEESLMSLTWKLANEQARLILNKGLVISEEDFYTSLSSATFHCDTDNLRGTFCGNDERVTRTIQRVRERIDGMAQMKKNVQL